MIKDPVNKSAIWYPLPSEPMSFRSNPEISIFKMVLLLSLPINVTFGGVDDVFCLFKGIHSAFKRNGINTAMIKSNFFLCMVVDFNVRLLNEKNDFVELIYSLSLTIMESYIVVFL